MGGKRTLARRLPGARAAVSAAFFLNGAGFASWVVRIPDVRERLGLSESGLGVALLAVALGALIAMPLSGGLIARFGSRLVAQLAAITFALALAVPPHANESGALTLALLVLGAANSVLAVALNTQAAAIERRFRRPVMAGLHALYSLGGLVGAVVGGAVAGLGVPVGWHLGAAALGITALMLAINSRLLPPGVDGATGGPAFARPTRPLVILGIIAFCVLFGEGAAADWSAVYLRDVAGAGPGLAAAGFASFSLMMAAGRFVGDALTLRLGPIWLVRAGGMLAAAGIGLALVVPLPWAVVLGLGAVGAGLSTVFPTVLAATGRMGETAPATALAAVSSIGYLGFLAGPPAIGFLAEVLTLRGAFGLVGATSLFIASLAGALPLAQSVASRGRPVPHVPLSTPTLTEA